MVLLIVMHEPRTKIKGEFNDNLTVDYTDRTFPNVNNNKAVNNKSIEKDKLVSHWQWVMKDVEAEGTVPNGTYMEQHIAANKNKTGDTDTNYFQDDNIEMVVVKNKLEVKHAVSQCINYEFMIKEEIEIKDELVHGQDVIKILSEEHYKHNSTTDTIKECYASNNDLNCKRKMQLPFSQFKCTLCDIAFPTMSNLKKHHKIHTGETPFKCSQCDKAYTLKCSLKRHHMKVHSYQCSQCKQSCNDNNHLEKHAKIQSGYKPFQCSQCDKAFIEHRKLRKHVSTHISENIHKCSKCTKSFSDNEILLDHLKEHTDKRYQCSYCAKTFSQKDPFELVKHMKIHTGKTHY